MLAISILLGRDAAITSNVQFQGIRPERRRQWARGAGQDSLSCRLVQKFSDQDDRRGGLGPVFIFRILQQQEFALGTALVFEIVRAAQLPDWMFDEESQIRLPVVERVQDPLFGDPLADWLGPTVPGCIGNSTRERNNPNEPVSSRPR